MGLNKAIEIVGFALEGTEDWVGLWELDSTARVRVEDDDEERVLAVTLELTRELIEDGDMIAADPDVSIVHRSQADPWDLSTDEIIDRIERECRQLGRPPGLAEIVHFYTTEKGEDLLRHNRFLER